jgi:hypothetical protein
MWSHTASPVAVIVPPPQSVAIAHDDILGRHYAYCGKNRVMVDETYRQMMVADAIMQAALAPIITTVNLPAVFAP